MFKPIWCLVAACLVASQSFAASAQAETPLQAYERVGEPYAKFEVYGQMAQICGIRNGVWVSQLNTHLFQAKITDKELVALEEQLSDSEAQEASNHFKKFQSEIYSIVLGRNVQEGCQTLQAMPFMSKVDQMATGD